MRVFDQHDPYYVGAHEPEDANSPHFLRCMKENVASGLVNMKTGAPNPMSTPAFIKCGLANTSATATTEGATSAAPRR